MNTKRLTQERLLELLRYDPADGLFTRRNGATAGHLNKKGYVQIKVQCVGYQAHRLAWLYMTGKWPKADIDHRNGLKADNRFENLRSVTHRTNARNQVGRKATGASKKLGVCFSKTQQKWRAEISTKSGKRSLGSYDFEHHAIAARQAGEKAFGYDSNHGLDQDQIIVPPLPQRLERRLENRIYRLRNQTRLSRYNKK